MSTEAENRAEPVNAVPANAKPVKSESVASERVEAERVDGAPVNGQRIASAPVEAAPVEAERVDGERIDGVQVESEPVRARPLEITITADEAFARAMRRNEVRQSHRSLALTALVATLLIATSLGSTVAEAPWWTAFGMVGLAGGFIVWVVVIGSLFQRHEAPPGLLDPTRYVFGLEALEWSTDSTTTRLNWSAVGNVRSLPHGYQINRKDGGTAVVICRTTLSAEQDARLRSYFSGLAAMLTTTGA